jgi:hypothetical protein
MNTTILVFGEKVVEARFLAPPLSEQIFYAIRCRFPGISHEGHNFVNYLLKVRRRVDYR